jgi:hypothetical protein
MADGNAFIKKCMHRLQFFLQHPKDASVTAGRTSGKEALQTMFDEMKVTFEDKDLQLAVKLLDLEPFQVYKWLLTIEQRKVLSGWVTTVLAHQKKKPTADDGVIAALTSGHPPPPPPASGKAVKRKLPGNSDTNKASILKFFGA